MIRLVLCYSYFPIGTYIYMPGFVLFLLAYLYLVYICLVLCYSYLPIYWYLVYTPGFVLFLLSYWYFYIYAWFCAILTCLLHAWYLVYIRLVLCYSYLPIGTCIYIYTPGFVLFLLAYWYLVYIRLVLCYFYLSIGITYYRMVYFELPIVMYSVTWFKQTVIKNRISTVWAVYITYCLKPWKQKDWLMSIYLSTQYKTRIIYTELLPL